MLINGRHHQSIWFDKDLLTVNIIDQTCLPHDFVILKLDDLDAVCHAITAMQVRGAPLIGVTAAYGMYLAIRDKPSEQKVAMERLLATRPTAVNLRWALQRMTL